MNDLTKTIVPTGSSAETPVPDFDDRLLASSAYDLLVWEEKLDAAVEQGKLMDDDRTQRMPNLQLLRQRAMCRSSTFLGLLDGGYRVNFDSADGAPTMELPVVRVTKPLPVVFQQRGLSLRKLVGVAAVMLVLAAFLSGLLAAPYVGEQMARDRCDASVEVCR